MSDKKWINWVLMAAVVAIFAVSFILAPRPVSDDEESFAGTDSVVTEVLEEGGAEPWFSPVFEAGSGELESGLFAMQAAIGAGLLGYAMGNLRGRKKGREQAAGLSPTSGPAPAVAPTPTG